MLMLFCDSEERRDVVEVSIEKLSSTSLSDAERDFLNKLVGKQLTRSKGELVDTWQSKSLRENESTVFETVSKKDKIIAFGEFPVGTLKLKLTMWH